MLFFCSISILQAGGERGLRAFFADHLEAVYHGGFEAFYLRQVLIPHLGVGQHGVDQGFGGVVLVGIVELQRPAVVTDQVGVALGALADQALVIELLVSLE